MACSKKKIKLSIGTFLRQYRRIRDTHVDPNDRHYDRKLEKIIKTVKPEDLSDLMFGEHELK